MVNQDSIFFTLAEQGIHTPVKIPAIQTKILRLQSGMNDSTNPPFFVVS